MLLLHVLLTPTAVLVASVVQRRFGPAVGGHVLALPLTTGPFLVLVGLRSGAAATAHAADGVVIGELSVMAFCACYGQLAQRRAVPAALGCSIAATLGCALLAALGHGLATWLAAILVASTCLGSAALQPSLARRVSPIRKPRAWELPVRVVLTTAIVATLLGLSAALGPTLAGTLATLPVILSVMVPATHARDGANAATAIARSTLVGLPATTAGVCVVGLILVPLGAVAATVLGLAGLIATEFAASAMIRSLDQRTAAASHPAH